MSPRRIAGEGKKKDTPLDAMLRPHANQSDEKPYSVWGPVTVWATSRDEALERIHDLLGKPRPEFRGYRASIVVQRIQEEPVSMDGIKKRNYRASPEEIARRLRESELRREKRDNSPPAA